MTMTAGSEIDALVAEKVFGFSDPIEVSYARSLKTADKWFTAFKGKPKDDRYRSGIHGVHVARDGTKIYCAKPFPIYFCDRYSSSLLATWEVVEFLISHTEELKTRYAEQFALEYDLETKQWAAGFKSADYDVGSSWDDIAYADTAPLAICLVALDIAERAATK